MFGSRKPSLFGDDVDMSAFAPVPGLGAALQQPTRNPSFFGEGGTGRGVAGTIGDFLLQRSGAAPIYAPAMQQQRAIAQRAQMEQAAQYAPQKVGDNIVRLNPQTGAYETVYSAPASPTPSSLERNYQFIKGMNPGLADQYLESQAMAPPLVVPNADGTRTVYPGGAIPRGAAPSRPPVGSVIPDPRRSGGAAPGPQPFR